MFGVSKGSYSDYTLVCLFEDKADAEAFKEAVNKENPEEAQVEEFPLYTKGTLPKRITVYTIASHGESIHSYIYEEWDFERKKSEVCYWSFNGPRVRAISIVSLKHALELYEDVLKKIKEGTLVPTKETQYAP